MKPLKIDEKNTQTIYKLIHSIEGKSVVNCLSINKIEMLAIEAENRLIGMGIPKKYRIGAGYYYLPSGPTASSYKYGQGATSVSIVRQSSGWAVKEITRTKVYPKSEEVNNLILYEVQSDIATKNFRSTFVTVKTNALA